VNILVGITKARDIPVFDEAVKLVLPEVDKLYACYYPQVIALEHIIRKYFLEHEQYTHLAILPDDLIVTKESWDYLTGDLERYDYPVICGCCNVDTTTNRDSLNVSLSCPYQSGIDVYKWVQMDSAEHQQILNTPQPYPVGFAGFPLTIIRRDIVQQIPFHNDPVGWAQDIAFCNDLINNHIQLYCDFRAQMLHVKISDSNILFVKVGLKPPVNYLEPATQNTSNDASNVPILQER
jgi:hypothetical protein